MWSAVCRQCALTFNVGHAFSLVLVYQKLQANSQTLEEWETVTAEKGHWAMLYSNLEVLVLLSNIVGVEALKHLPPIPFENISDDKYKKYSINPAKLSLQFFDKGLRLPMQKCVLISI